MSDGIDAVLFDLDGTLVEYERGVEELLPVAFDAVGVEPYFSAQAYYDRYAELVDESTDMLDLRRRCFASLAEERGRDPETGRAIADAYAAERDHSRVNALPGAREAVDALASDYRLGLVTNGAPGMQRTKLAAVGLDGSFETEVFAGHDTPSKPHPEPFRRALADLGASPERTVYVGNSIRSDVAGARAAGCRSVWVPADDDLTPDPAPDFALPTVADLVDPPWR